MLGSDAPLRPALDLLACAARRICHAGARRLIRCVAYSRSAAATTVSSTPPEQLAFRARRRGAARSNVPVERRPPPDASRWIFRPLIDLLDGGDAIPF
jgi:hypothetical protein